jgi:hypothetical protein
MKELWRPGEGGKASRRQEGRRYPGKKKEQHQVGRHTKKLWAGTRVAIYLFLDALVGVLLHRFN